MTGLLNNNEDESSAAPHKKLHGGSAAPVAVSEPSLPLPVVKKKHTIVEQLVHAIREDILHERLRPGESLREENLARTHSVSRHALREAFRTLAAEGLAVYEPFQGARVALISRTDVQDVYAARQVLEIGALNTANTGTYSHLATIHMEFAQAVAEKRWDDAFVLDRAFHSAIVAEAGSPTLCGWLNDLFKKLQLAHLLQPSFRRSGAESSVGEHAQIVVALAAGQKEQAQAALKAHLVGSEQSLGTLFSSA